ncbi:GNAT family N-acetyltransferase [Angustibacter sp. McL0619]|uniref:GNAT family N-acetyltransferase n=1 Tax=Angustibacter sp. McL0619 TaxID=3415676 RepID=UPI003CF4760B
MRQARRTEHGTIRSLLTSAYWQFADTVPAPVFARYLDDLLDLDRHAEHGTIMVAESGGRIYGSGTFYPDAAVQGLGLPSGWAGGRGLAVRPQTRGLGIARALVEASRGMARETGAPVFAFHSAVFMTAARDLYTGLGFERAPRYDVDLAEHYGFPELAPIPVLAFVDRTLSTSARGDRRLEDVS